MNLSFGESTPEHRNYVTARESLREVPPAQLEKVKALLRHEKDRLRFGDSPNPRYALLNYYEHEADRAAYVIFQNGEFQGFNNRRAMARLISICKTNAPEKAVLVHRMGSPIDFDLVNRLDLQAKDDPGSWIQKRDLRVRPPEGEPPIHIKFSDPS